PSARPKTPAMAARPLSPASTLALVPTAARAQALAALSDEEVAALEYDWVFWARPTQLPPAWAWKVWLILAGRGWGRTRTAPEHCRGTQQHYAWCDELAKWRYAQDVWDNLELGLRLGTHPQVVTTTTPRPIPLLRQLIADAQGDKPRTAVTRGSTYENTVNM